MFKLLFSLSEPSAMQPDGNGSNRRFGKKLYVLAAAILVIVVVCAFLFVNNSGATVPLSLNYQVGERMVYSTSSSMVTQMINQTNNIAKNNTLNTDSSMTTDVLAFDGKTYTLNNTYSLNLFGYKRNVTVPQLVTTDDYVDNFLIGEAARLLYNMTGDKVDYYKLNILQAKIGDTIQIPVNTGNESIGTTGTLTVKFAAIEDLTVPAGTFKVFRLDYTADFKIHANLNGLISIQLSEPIPGQINGQTYLEYGTCRLIKSHVQEFDQYTGAMPYNYTCTTERTLTELSTHEPEPFY